MSVKVPKIATHTLNKLPDAFQKYFTNFASSVGVAVAPGDSATSLTNLPGNIKARGWRNASQSLSSGIAAKVLIDTISFDPSNIVDIVTNNRITPNQAGYYDVNGQISLQASYSNVYSAIYKNGTVAARGSQGTLISSSVGDKIYMNGTTDYLELWAYSVTGVSLQGGYSSLNYISVLGPF